VSTIILYSPGVGGVVMRKVVIDTPFANICPYKGGGVVDGKLKKCNKQSLKFMISSVVVLVPITIALFIKPMMFGLLPPFTAKLKSKYKLSYD
jgi:hypothetical protein